VPRCSSDLTSWVGAGPAQVEVLYGGSVGHPTGKILARGDVYVANVAVGHPRMGLHVLRGLKRPAQQGVPEEAMG
jgi:hypothetical protein